MVSVAAAACLALAGFTATGVRAKVDSKRLVEPDILERGAVWLQEQQASDGGYPNLRGEVAFGATADAVCTLVALRTAGIAVETEAAVAYLEKNAQAQVEALAGGAGRAAVALAAAGADPRDDGGMDLIALIDDGWDSGSNSFGGDVFANCYALLALAAAGKQIPNEAIKTLEAVQIADGSWSSAGTTDPGSGDAVMTAFVVQVLAAAGRDGDDPVIAGAIDSFRAVQVDGGAFAYSSGFPPDSNTTALVVSALTAAQVDLGSSEWSGAVAALSAFQNDSGAFHYTDQEQGDDIQVTMVSLLALAGGALSARPAD